MAARGRLPDHRHRGVGTGTAGSGGDAHATVAMTAISLGSTCMDILREGLNKLIPFVVSLSN
ncbi:MAG: hypothetical protein ACREPE_10775 [Lysobacter sp.]